MKAYLLFETKLFLKETKNKLMFVIFIIFLLYVYFLIAVQGSGNIEQEQAEQMNASRVAISSIAATNSENEETSALYENIYQQQQLLSQQDNGIRFEDRDWYLDSAIELAQLQIELYDYDEFNDLDTPLRSVIPSIHTARKDLARFIYIRDNDIPIMYEQDNAAGFMMLYFSTFGVAVFLFLLLYSGSILTNDLDHETMVKGYPVTHRQKVVSKILIYTVASFFSIFAMTGLVVLIIWAIKGSGDLTYPMIIYNHGFYRAISIAQYTLIYFSYLVILTIHVVSLSSFLNILLKNVYATLLVGVVCFAIPLVAQNWIGWLRWTPIPYYNPFAILSGDTSYLANQEHLTLVYGGGVLLIWSMLFLIIVYAINSLENKSYSIE
ncbi:hypothetical protein [Marinilactibacillus sp. Marseille-P9653]|uniref:hypothetical protein n=1 Tax=Marinilactibacillus sp. Marseille-P9653 TaxID=2866583 RepID=UPI001CE3D513|nr:hypothetical protein [Marinilactibacillus sp. Marseille-P9653]